MGDAGGRRNVRGEAHRARDGAKRALVTPLVSSDMMGAVIVEAMSIEQLAAKALLPQSQAKRSAAPYEMYAPWHTRGTNGA